MDLNLKEMRKIAYAVEKYETERIGEEDENEWYLLSEKLLETLSSMEVEYEEKKKEIRSQIILKMVCVL